MEEKKINFCRKCGSRRYIPYGDFIKIGKEIIRHIKCLNCGNCYKEE